MGVGEKTPAQAAGMVVPFKDWRDVAQKVKPITTPNRPDWQTQDEHINADKEFQKLDIGTAKEATTTKKRRDSGFRVRKGVKVTSPILQKNRFELPSFKWDCTFCLSARSTGDCPTMRYLRRNQVIVLESLAFHAFDDMAHLVTGVGRPVVVATRELVDITV